MVSTERRGAHEAVLVRRSLRKPVDDGLFVEMVYADGRNTDAGEIVEAEPPRRLAPILKRSNHGKGNFRKSFVGSSSGTR